MKTSESAFKSYLNEDFNDSFKKSWFINAYSGLQFIIWKRKVWVTKKKTFESLHVNSFQQWLPEKMSLNHIQMKFSLMHPKCVNL